ncbi:MAG: ABC transporter permease [Actinobacteria bacterium]|nr:ABC transporter permease [Actinomycetota bacterium]
MRWDWIGDHLDEVRARGLEHVQLTVLTLVIGFAISFPLALIAHRHRRIYPPLTWVTGILYTIPSLALFVALLPITGLGTTTALIGLVSYTLLIFIRNTVAGLDGVPQDAKEAARGMGYTPRQILWRVEVPLAMPVIVAGVRIAAVTTVGLVTITALIGLGGFGHFILRGLREFFSTLTLLGSVLSVLLALVVDASLLVVERWLTPWARAGRRSRAVRTQPVTTSEVPAA